MLTSRPYYACRSHIIHAQPPSSCPDLKFSTAVQSSENSRFSIECSLIVQSFSESCLSQIQVFKKIGAPSESGWSKSETLAVSSSPRSSYVTGVGLVISGGGRNGCGSFESFSWADLLQGELHT